MDLPLHTPILEHRYTVPETGKKSQVSREVFLSSGRIVTCPESTALLL